MIAQPGNEHVIPWAPEIIIPQYGKEKQDCEIEAAKRWVDGNGDFFAKHGVTVMGDDLFSCQPFVKKLKEKGLRLILVCQPIPLVALVERVDLPYCQWRVGVLSEAVLEWKLW